MSENGCGVQRAGHFHGLKEAEVLDGDIHGHWYYRSKAISRLLGDLRGVTILDVGAGSAVFSRHLLRHSQAAGAWCVDVSYAHDDDAREAGKPLHYRRDLTPVDVSLALLMDVLEHVDDDVGLLRQCVGVVPRGTRFLISVPAFQLLWSGHDEFLEHKRRYTLGQIVEVVERGGLVVERGAYYFGLVFPLALASRVAGRWLSPRDAVPRSQLKKHNSFVNAALSVVCRAELPLLAFNRLAGLTAFCVARAP